LTWPDTPSVSAWRGGQAVTEMIESVAKEIDARQLAAQLVEQARIEGVDLSAPAGC
jgi:hypothetical protein